MIKVVILQKKCYIRGNEPSAAHLYFESRAHFRGKNGFAFSHGAAHEINSLKFMTGVSLVNLSIGADAMLSFRKKKQKKNDQNHNSTGR